MVNTVLNSVTKQLGSTFGSKYHYYVEDVEQKLARPCFTVDVLNPLCRSVNSTDYRWTIPVVVHYYTNNERLSKQDCYSIGNQALESLEYITISNRLVRGEDMSFTLADDVLEIFITYRFWSEKERSVLDTMDDVELLPTKVIE